MVLPFVEIKEGWKASYIELSCNLTRKRHGAAQRFCHYRRVFWLVDVHGGKSCGTFKFFSRRLVVRLQPLAMTTPGRVEHDEDAGIIRHELIKTVISQVDHLTGLIRPGCLTSWLLISLGFGISEKLFNFLKCLIIVASILS